MKVIECQATRNKINFLAIQLTLFHICYRFPKLFTKDHGRVQLHPKSVNAGTKHYESHWIIFHEMMKTSGVRCYIYCQSLLSSGSSRKTDRE